MTVLLQKIKKEVAPQGIEPRLREPESLVLSIKLRSQN